MTIKPEKMKVLNFLGIQPKYYFYIKINILYNNKNIDQCYKVFSEMAELIVVLELTISPEIS